MCSIKKTYIPEKHKQFWNEHYKRIMRDCGADDSIWNYLIAIRS